MNDTNTGLTPSDFISASVLQDGQTLLGALAESTEATSIPDPAYIGGVDLGGYTPCYDAGKEKCDCGTRPNEIPNYCNSQRLFDAPIPPEPTNVNKEWHVAVDGDFTNKDCNNCRV